MYSKKVDLRSKSDMKDFLKNHFMYDTMNSWNNSVSFANNMKVWNLPSEYQEVALNLLEVEDIYDGVDDLIMDFNASTDYEWQAGFNGKSGGYLVLYQGGVKDSEYKSKCPDCGQLRYKTIAKCGTKCGRCRESNCYDLSEPIMRPYTYPGRGIDVEGYLNDSNSLKELVEIVCDFDKLCDDIINHWIELCKNYAVVDEEILVPKTVKRLLAIA